MMIRAWRGSHWMRKGLREKRRKEDLGKKMAKDDLKKGPEEKSGIRLKEDGTKGQDAKGIPDSKKGGIPDGAGTTMMIIVLAEREGDRVEMITGRGTKTITALGDVMMTGVIAALDTRKRGEGMTVMIIEAMIFLITEREEALMTDRGTVTRGRDSEMKGQDGEKIGTIVQEMTTD